MKDWLMDHKLPVIAAIIIIFGGIYYIYFNPPQPTDITGLANEKENINLQSNPLKNEEKVNSQPVKIIVDVKGQVKQPGVYDASQGERVIDVINRAGGLTEKADETKVNFAEHVQDEMVIYIPVKGEDGQIIAGNSTMSGESTSKNQAKVNINKADANELQNLPGIGPAKAKAIMEYRDKSGPFKAPEDIKNISGIGEKTFEKLKDLIAVH